MLYTIVFFAWLVAAAGFVLGLHLMNSPATARRGNQLSAAGMAVAVLTTLLWLASRPRPRVVSTSRPWIIIIVGFVIGGGIGLYLARTVKMTAMPQLVSLFNAVGGGAAALVAINDYFRIVGNDRSPMRSRPPSSWSWARSSAPSRSRARSSRGKLQGLIPGAPIIRPWTRPLTLGVAAITAIGTLLLVLGAAGVFGLGVGPRTSSSSSSSAPRSSSASPWCCPSAAPTCRSSSAS